MMHDAKLDGKINVYLNVHKVTVRSLCILAYHTRCFDPSSYFIFITNDYVRHTYISINAFYLQNPAFLPFA